MARPERHDADYFPFYAKRGRTLNILQSKFGCEGIGVFTNILRFLTLTPDHHYCIKDETDRMNFFAEIGIQEERGLEIIELMVKTEKLDKGLWENYKVIASCAFLESLTDAYKQRKNKIITINEIREKFVSMYGNPEKSNNSEVSMYGNPEKQRHNTQRKGKERIVKERKGKDITETASPEVFEPSSSPQNPPKPKKLPLRQRDPINDFERVEKVYLHNYDSLFSQGKVKTTEPVVNWNQTRKLLKGLFERLTVDQIIEAINNGMNDSFILNGAYSLGTMLSSTVLNRLINAGGPGQARHKIGLDNVQKDKAASYLREVQA